MGLAQNGCGNTEYQTASFGGIRTLRALKVLRILKIVRLFKLIKFFRRDGASYRTSEQGLSGSQAENY